MGCIEGGKKLVGGDVKAVEDMDAVEILVEEELVVVEERFGEVEEVKQ